MVGSVSAVCSCHGRGKGDPQRLNDKPKATEVFSCSVLIVFLVWLRLSGVGGLIAEERELLGPHGGFLVLQGEIL